MIRALRHFLVRKASPPRWTDRDLERPLLWHWESAVSSFGASPALRFGKREWSYLELDFLSTELARKIAALPATERAPIGIATSPGPEVVVAMLASIRSDRPFVVLSMEEPLERRRLVARLSQIEILLHDDSPGSGEIQGARRRLPIETDAPPKRWRRATRGRPEIPFPGATTDLALVFTSGSEDEPAGVRRTQRSQLHLVRDLSGRCAIGPGDRVSMIIPPSFGACLNDVFLSLLTGATLCPFALGREGAARLLDWLLREEITYCHCVPSVLRSLSRQDPGLTRRLSSLRWFKVGGEPLFRSEARMLASHFPRTTSVLYSYGSTETGGTMAARILERDPGTAPDFDDSEPLDVGSAIPGKDLLILDADGSPLPPGEVGEIAVRSRYLAAGYFRNEASTAERFHPGLDDPGLVLYRTRDLGRFDAAGRLHHLGRLDGQLKIRGIRVNPGEIEARLREHPAIAEAAVVPGAGGSELFAFLTGDSPQTPAPSQLKDALSRQMPRGMFPQGLVWLDSLPRLGNGKVDRAALRKLTASAARPPESQSTVPPRDPLEQMVAEIWERLLGRSGIGVYDRFFELGGDSLAAVNFQADLARRLEVDLPLALLFGDDPTVAHVVEQVRHGLGSAIDRLKHPGATAAPLLSFARIRAGEEGRPLVFLPGGYGSEAEMMLFVRLVSAFGAAHPICGFLASQLYLLDPPPRSVEEVAARHLETLRREVSSRAPILVGHCVAGALAYEMARQWEPPSGSRERPGLILVEAASRRGWRRRRGLKGGGSDETPSHPEFARYYFDLLDRYRPGLFPGSVHLLVSESFHDPGDPTLGWKDFVEGEIHLERIAGDHHEAIHDFRAGLARILAGIVDTRFGESGIPDSIGS